MFIRMSGGWREPVITIISNKMNQDMVDLIISRTQLVGKRHTLMKGLRYIPDDRGIFYFSDRYDMNYTHLWEE